VRMCSGCGTKLPDSYRGRCEACKGDAPRDASPGREHKPVGADASRDTHAELYRTPRWTKVSKLQRGRFPVCERRGPDCTGLAEIADHYIPAVVYVEMCRDKKKFLIATEAFFDMSNLQSLCRTCHAVKSDEDTAAIARGGPWTELGRPPRQWNL
jgi:hypothetical protein